MEHIGTGQIQRLVDALKDAVLLQPAEERFRHTIDSTIAFTTTGFLTMGIAKPLEVIAAVLTAQISGRGLRRLTSPDFRQQSIKCPLTAKRCVHRPVHDLARVQVYDGRQITQSQTGRDSGPNHFSTTAFKLMPTPAMLGLSSSSLLASRTVHTTIPPPTGESPT